MKNYNIQNYIRYKKDLEENYKRLPHAYDYQDYSRDELIVLFMPLVENIARKFSTSQQASGVMSIKINVVLKHIGIITSVKNML